MDILNEKIEGLVNKAEKSKMPYGILKKVYDRGMAAWKTGHRPGTTPQQWAFARVNSFITKSSGTWGKADADLAKQVRGEEVQEKRTTAKGILGQIIKEARYEIGFTKGEVDMVISDRPGELAMIVQDELDSERIRAKVKSTGDEFTLEFNTNIPQRKMLKILDDKFGYTAFAEQIKEKLSKNADAGDYIDDFKKSDAPQFKGKSDKKKEKMAVAAYLDSKEEVGLEEGGVPARFGLSNSEKMKLAKDFDKLASDRTTSPNEKIYYKNTAKYFMDNMPDKAFNDMMGGAPEHIGGTIGRRTSAIIGKDKTKKVTGYREEFKEENCPKCDDDPCKCENIQESGHTDVASMKTQVQIATDALQKMNTELGKLSDEEDLPTWWTNKVASAVGKLDGMADYIDAKHQQGEKMNEAPRQLEDPKKETMVMKKKDVKSIMVIDKKDLQKYTSKGYIQVESNDVELNIESLDKEDEKSVKKVIKGLKKAVDAHSGQVKSLTKDIKDEVDNITEETVFVVRFEKEGMRFATPFYDMKNAKDGEKILKRSSGVSNISITKDLLKPGIKLSTQEGIIVKEENLEVSEVQEVVDNSIMARTTRLISQTAIKEKLDPADVDVRATDLDRKAADKNIFIQLKRAQDMNGKTDVEFLDKKKQKVDIRVINKALDMFDKMKPNDKLKMQLAIGKSYRDLLKVVQRGKV